jgi:hypothetical protein
METKTNDALLDGGITQATFNDWKIKYGTVHKIAVVVNKGDKDHHPDIAYGYIRDVNDDLDLMSSVLSIQAGNKVLEAKVFLLNNAWLGGDIRCTTVNKVMISAATQASQTVDILDGSVEKL